MSSSPILHVPNSILRKQSKPVQIDAKTCAFAKELQTVLREKSDPKGVGLSAPQIGKNWNIFVTWLHKNDPDKDPKPEDMIVFINPEITDVSKDITYGDDPDNPILEGCLSIPGLYGPVPRFSSVTIRYYTLDKKSQISQVNESFSGFHARVIQHEYDHLHGILFTDYTLKNDLPLYRFSGKKMVEADKNLIHTF